MRGREIYRSGRRATLLVTVLAGVLAFAALAPLAEAKSKKKKVKPPAVTRTAAVPLPPGTQQSATASCSKGTHISGGGFSVSPPYSANGTDALTNDSGTRSIHLQSQSGGNRSWIAGAAAFTTPPLAGTLTSLARCERNDLGSLAVTLAGSSTIPVSQGTTTTLNCPGGTHALTSGFAGSPPGNLAAPTGATAKRLVIAESRRISPTSWEVRAVNPDGAPSVATLSTNVVCERNGKRGVTEAAAVAPIIDNGRTSATATCAGKKQHVVGGGFLVSPFTSPSPAVGIDQNQPVGQRSWQVGLYEFPTFLLPLGSSLTAYAYCKKN
jgi:hypothetical protein